nr:hypothetical protein [Tanacetum cinerariifolium]
YTSAPAADSEAKVLAEWNALYDAHKEVACLMLGSMTLEHHRQFENYSPYEMLQELRSMFEKQDGVERFDLIQTFHACKQEEGKSVVAYVLQMKGCVDQLERLGYVLPQDLTVGLILNEHPTKDDACHHCKEVGHWKRNCPVYLVEFLKKKKQVVRPGFRKAKKLKQGALYLYVGNGVRAQVEAIRSFDLVLPNRLVICLDNFHYAPSITRGVVSVHHLVENGFVSVLQIMEFQFLRTLLKHKHEVFETFKVFKNEVENQLGKTIKALRSDRDKEYISQEFKYYLKACGIFQQLTPPYTPQHNGMSERRNRTLLDMVRSMMNLTTLSLSFWDYALEFVTRILNMVPTKKELVKWDTPDQLQQRSVKCTFIRYPKETMGYYFYFPLENKIVIARYAEFFEKNLITQEVSGRDVDLEEIQDEDTSPSEITSKIPMEVEGFEPPQEEVISIRRTERTQRASDRLCLNVEVKEHSLGDLNEPASYKAAMLDSKSNKWIDAMNAKIQSMIDNMIWVLVDLPPGCKTVGSKWIFKKKTDMDGIVHTYKARLVAKGYTQLYE